MHEKYKQTINKAMGFLISQLEVDHKFISVFQEENIIDDDTVDEIMVSCFLWRHKKVVTVEINQ